MTNLVTYAWNPTNRATRASEVAESSPGVDFNKGLNMGATNAPGIGVCTDVVDPKVDDWTTLNQREVARDPETSQHVGGDGSTVGISGHTGALLRAIQGDQPGDGGQTGVDVNDTMAFVVAGAQAAPGVGVGVGNIDPVNRSSVTVEIGDRVWGTNTVA